MANKILRLCDKYHEERNGQASFTAQEIASGYMLRLEDGACFKFVLRNERLWLYIFQADGFLEADMVLRPLVD